jgi:hypothetical protein
MRNYEVTIDKELLKEQDEVYKLQVYRDQMECPMETLSITLLELGIIHQDNAGMLDYEMVELATRKIRVMYKMLKACGVNEKLLEAVMSE